MLWRARNIFGSVLTGEFCGQLIRNDPSDCQYEPPAIVKLRVETLMDSYGYMLTDLIKWKLMESDTNCIIGVYGAAGIGKTTLMKTINNHLFLEHPWDFDIVIFATVSRQHPLASVQTAILKRLLLPWQGREGSLKRAARITVALEGKRCLLLLDDILSPFDLKLIGLPLSDEEKNNKIVLAARSDEVCEKMGATVTFRLKPLDRQFAGELFSKHAGDNFTKLIPELCGGIPLTLVTVGRSMASTPNHWSQGLRDLLLFFGRQSSLHPGMAHVPVLSAFTFMYEKILDDKFRDCLDWFTLFPKNSSINKQELIRIWFGEGILSVPESENNISSVFSHGHKIMERLKEFGMLMHGEDPDTEVMMQDLVHDLIFDRKRNKFIVNVWVTHKSTTSLEAAKIEKISLMESNMDSLPNLPEELTSLKTLVLERNIYLKKIDSEYFFRDTPALRFLDLSRTDITTIPISIGELSKLRHLDLSFTKIKSLPPVMKKLKNLVQLILEGTRSLTHIPDGLLCELAQVEVVNLYNSFASGPKEIHELEKLKHLKELGITISIKLAWETLAESQTLRDSTARLLLKDCEHLKHVLVPPCKGNLKVVSICDCRDLEDIKFEDGSNVEELQLKGLYKLKNVCGALCRKLERLDISLSHELKDVSWVLGLENLESINVESCKRMEQVVRNKEVQGSINNIKRLKKVTLRNLPRLSSLWDDSLFLPKLSYVKVLQCPPLLDLPAKIKGADTVEIHGELSWWNALDSTSVQWIFQAAE